MDWIWRGSIWCSWAGPTGLVRLIISQQVFVSVLLTGRIGSGLFTLDNSNIETVGKRLARSRASRSSLDVQDACGKDATSDDVLHCCRAEINEDLRLRQVEK